MIFHVDPEVYAPTARALERDLGRYRTVRSGPLAATAVSCPRCGAYRGDWCHDGRDLFDELCGERREANDQRLRTLPTWAVPWSSPCCKAGLWLCWRDVRNRLSWMGVPCLRCLKTYAVDLDIDLIDERTLQSRIQIARLYPEHVVMRCWASEERCRSD